VQLLGKYIFSNAYVRAVSTNSLLLFNTSGRNWLRIFYSGRQLEMCFNFGFVRDIIEEELNLK